MDLGAFIDQSAILPNFFTKASVTGAETVSIPRLVVFHAALRNGFVAAPNVANPAPTTGFIAAPALYHPSERLPLNVSAPLYKVGCASLNLASLRNLDTLLPFPTIGIITVLSANFPNGTTLIVVSNKLEPTTAIISCLNRLLAPNVELTYSFLCFSDGSQSPRAMAHIAYQ